MKNKKCNVCNIVKPASDFYFRKPRNCYDYLCKSCCSIRTIKYYNNNKNKLLDSNKKRWHKNKDRYSRNSKKWRDDNKNKIRDINKIWYNKNKEKVFKYHTYKYHTNINYRIKILLSSRIRQVLQGGYKSNRTVLLLGCSIEFFKGYLSAQFKDGMSWNNYGYKGWHIDHIRPCASFDLSKPEQQKECFHYTNLQPLWWYDNLKKSDKIISFQKAVNE